jgi:Peptidoglycan-binding protein, CsiV
MKHWLRIKISLILVMALGYQTAAFANERWYRVELLIIEHKDKSGVMLEEWPLDPGYPSVRAANYVQKLTADSTPNNFIQLENDELDLFQARKSLIKRTGNKVLLHTGWRQLVKEDEPEAVRLSGGNTYQYSTNDGDVRNFDLQEFDGTFTILLSRYLHVITDLVFHKPMEVVETESSYEHTMMQRLRPLANENDWEGLSNAGLQRFRINSKRKLRKNDVTYIDHPLYGILIKVSDDKREENS